MSRGFYIDENALSSAVGSRLALRGQTAAERLELTRARTKEVHPDHVSYTSRYRDEGSASAVNVVISPPTAVDFAEAFIEKVRADSGELTSKHH